MSFDSKSISIEKQTNRFGFFSAPFSYSYLDGDSYWPYSNDFTLKMMSYNFFLVGLLSVEQNQISLIPMNLYKRQDYDCRCRHYITLHFVRFLLFYAYNRHHTHSPSNFFSLSFSLVFTLTVSVEKNGVIWFRFVYIEQRKYSMAACTPVW